MIVYVVGSKLKMHSCFYERYTHTLTQRKRRMGEDILMGPAQERKGMKHVRWGGPQLAVVAMADSRRT